jgi:capsular exopolysaccharide synthesis family protein
MSTARDVHEVAPAAPRPAVAPVASLFHVLWRRRWAMVGCAIAAVCVALVYLNKAIPVYASSSQLYVQPQNPRVIAESVGGQAGNSGNYLLTQCELIRSSAILSAAVELPPLAYLKTLSGASNPVAVLRQALEVQAGKTDVLTVTATSTSAEDAAVIANAVVEAYIDYQAKRQRSTAAEVLKILQKEKEKNETALTAISRKMLEFKRANGTLSFDTDKGNVVMQRLAQLSDTLTAAQIDALNKKVAVDAVEAMGDDPAKLKQLVETKGMRGGGTANPFAESAEIAGQMRLAERRAAQLRGQYGPANRGVAAAEEEARSLKDQLAESEKAAVASYKAAVRQDLADAMTKERELRAAFDSQKAEALALNTNAAEYGQMQADARRAERMLDILDSRIKEINVNEDTGALNISVMEPARPDYFPVSPNRTRALGMALALGLLAGLGAAQVLEFLDQRLRSVDEISALLNVPVLGVVPHMLGKRTPSERGRVVAIRSQSDVAEAYRTVRTAVYFGAPENGKTLLVTSPTSGDGKTTVSSNLALAMAQASRRVLLIDADCRKPTQHRIFSLGVQPAGLSTVLMGKATFDEAVRPSGVENLDLLPCGPLPPNPSELLNSPAFGQLITSLCERYDQIVVDSPPVVPVTDSRILGAACDAVLLVLRAEKTTRRVAEHARDALVSVGATLVGAVVNDTPRNQYGYYYDYRYRYGYGYGYGGGNRGLEDAAAADDGHGSKGVTAVEVRQRSA